MTILLVILSVVVSICFVRDYLDLAAYLDADRLTQLEMGEPAMPHRTGVFAVLFWAATLISSYL